MLNLYFGDAAKICYQNMDETYLQFHESHAKRVFDFVFATIGLILLSPLFLFCVLVAKLQSPGPIFYRAQRVGRGGQLFEMYKFRTMVVNADSLGLNLTTFRDTRITPIGRFLRGTKLDELPNLINVIKGDMSLIGPRPETPVYVQHYTEHQKQVLRVRPGMTGPAQILNRNEEEKLKGQVQPEQYYITELMPKKLAIDLQYIETQSFASDLLWLAKTFLAIIFPYKRDNS